MGLEYGTCMLSYPFAVSWPAWERRVICQLILLPDRNGKFYERMKNVLNQNDLNTGVLACQMLTRNLCILENCCLLKRSNKT